MFISGNYHHLFRYNKHKNDYWNKYIWLYHYPPFLIYGKIFNNQEVFVSFHDLDIESGDWFLRGWM